jgi:hypothetical protein
MSTNVEDESVCEQPQSLDDSEGPFFAERRRGKQSG